LTNIYSLLIKFILGGIHFFEFREMPTVLPIALQYQTELKKNSFGASGVGQW
jgi:hypothetical protein